MKKLVTVLTVALGAATCGSIADSASPDVLFALGEEFTLSLGQRGATRDSAIQLKFNAVPTESRCPVDVTCVWEGYAQVALDVAAVGTKDVALLSTNATICCTADTVADFIIAIRGLEPVPRSGQRDIPYEVRLLVTKEP